MAFPFFSSFFSEGHEPGAHLKRFTPGQVFSRIGISPTLAGPRLAKRVQQACAQAGTAVFDNVDSCDSNELEEAAELMRSRKSAGALVAAAAARRRERETLFTDVGPCRRALCARRDLAIRKKLRRASSKVRVYDVQMTFPSCHICASHGRAE